MTTLTVSTPATTSNTSTRNDYADGHFDAATHAAPKQTDGDYYRGYLNYTKETGKAPF
ncbi:MAG TPA: hypothetical protein VE956_02110 [Nodularia sp. (in: cyanobacteria)]|nr:hypothetical protein [Nodularia sp. (in: cyanobacteria)]